MATKTDKKNAIRRDIIDAAVVYSQKLAGKAFLYVYGEEFFEVSFPADNFFLPMSLRVEDSSIEKSGGGEVVDFIFSKDASVSKYEDLLVKDRYKAIPERIRHLIRDSFYNDITEQIHI